MAFAHSFVTVKVIDFVYKSYIPSEFDFPKGRKWISVKIRHFYQILASVTNEWHRKYLFSSIHFPMALTMLTKVALELW